MRWHERGVRVHTSWVGGGWVCGSSAGINRGILISIRVVIVGWRNRVQLPIVERRVGPVVLRTVRLEINVAWTERVGRKCARSLK